MKEGNHISHVLKYVTKNKYLILHLICIATLIGFDTLAPKPSENFVVCPSSNDSFYHLTPVDNWVIRYGLLKKIAPLLLSFFDNLYALFLFVRVCFILFTYPILYHCLRRFTSEINSLFSSFFTISMGIVYTRTKIGIIDTDLVTLGLLYGTLALAYQPTKHRTILFYIWLSLSYLWYPKPIFVAFSYTIFVVSSYTNEGWIGVRQTILPFVMLFVTLLLFGMFPLKIFQRFLVLVNTSHIDHSIRELQPLSVDLIPNIIGFESSWIIGGLIVLSIILFIQDNKNSLLLWYFIGGLLFASFMFGKKYGFYLEPILWCSILHLISRKYIQILGLGFFIHASFENTPTYSKCGSRDVLLMKKSNYYTNGVVLTWWDFGNKINYYTHHKSLIDATNPRSPYVIYMAKWLLDSNLKSLPSFFSTNKPIYVYINKRMLKLVGTMDHLLHPLKSKEERLRYSFFTCDNLKNIQFCISKETEADMEDIGEIRVVADSDVQIHQKIHIGGTKNLTCIKKEELTCAIHSKNLETTNIHQLFFYPKHRLLEDNSPYSNLTVLNTSDSLYAECLFDEDGDGFVTTEHMNHQDYFADCNDSLSGAYPNSSLWEFCDFEGKLEFVDYNCDGKELQNAQRCEIQLPKPLSFSDEYNVIKNIGILQNIPDISGDGISDFVISDHTFSNNRGKLYFFEGPLVDESIMPFFTIEGEISGDHLGLKEISVGDINGDQINDLIIPTPFAQSKRGRVYLVLGPHKSNSKPLQFSHFQKVITIDGTETYSQFGWNTGFLGDIDGDDFSDFAISSRLYNKKQSGTLHLIFSDNSLFEQSNCYNIEELKDNIRHINRDLSFESDFAYSVVGLEDINGDSKDDFAVLERKVRETTKSNVHIYHGSSWVQWESYEPNTTISMNYEIGELGTSMFRNFKARQILNVGDINNDGQNDLALFSSTSKYNSSAKGDGMILIHTNLNSSRSRDAYLDASIILNNPISSGISSSFGQSLAIGRLNEDEFLDFIVGGKSIGTSNQGGLYIYYGPLQGEYDSAHGFIQSMSKDTYLGKNISIYSYENTQYMLFNTSFSDTTETPAKIYQIDHSTIQVEN